MEEKLEAFVRHGMQEDWKRYLEDGVEEGLPKVPADEVLNAIAEGRDIDIEYAVIDGDLDMLKIARQLEHDEEGRFLIKSDVKISHSEIRGYLSFSIVTFSEDADFKRAIFGRDASFSAVAFSRHASFSGATFSGDAKFRETTFSSDASFSAATFSGDADFSGYADYKAATFGGYVSFLGATFSGDADFGKATFRGHASFSEAAFARRADFSVVDIEYPGDFAGLRFDQNTVRAGLKNEILRPIVKRLTKGRRELQRRRVTDFSGFNTEKVLDGASNPRLKRYIDDEQWIESWRRSGRLQGFIFYIWEAMSHCGRSMGLWAGWSAFFALIFAFIYWGFGCKSITFNVGRLGVEQPSFWGYLYYSVVTFTTLGFGDIVPLTNLARLAVGTEVVFGYVMLGGLISIFANKFARRS